MSLSPKRKLLFFTAFMILLSLSWVGCRGFFTKPVLTKITVTPTTASVLVGKTQQLIATGTFDDNSSGDVTTTSSWSSADTTKVTVNSTGLITGVANTTSGVTVTAAKGAITGTTTVNVGTQTLTITAPNTTFSAANLPVGGVQLSAVLNGTDVTSSTTFTSGNTGVVVMSSLTNGLATFTGAQGTATITGTTTNATGTITLTVGP